MSSIVKDELDRIKSFADSTEKRTSKLTLNELNYISDKQLHSKGGSGDSPLGIAEVKLLPDGPSLSVGGVFADYTFAIYYPEEDPCPPISTVEEFETLPFGVWNSDMEHHGRRVIIPQAFYTKNDIYEYELEGAAEIRNDGDGNGEYIYITGDCTITVSEYPPTETGQG